MPDIYDITLLYYCRCLKWIGENGGYCTFKRVLYFEMSLKELLWVRKLIKETTI